MNKYLHTYAVTILLLLLFAACKREKLQLTTTSDVNITGYLEKDTARFSLFLQVLERTGSDGYLNAYGAYTLFVPDNDAMSAYLSATGKGNVNTMDVEQLKALIRIHLIADTITTASFTDGKMPAITEYGQFLVTGVQTFAGSSRYVINRQSVILQSNIITGNGIIHVINKVLEPATLTLAQLLEKDTRYSIFTQALKETGYYDSLNAITEDWLTVVAQSDSVYQSNYIPDYPSLKQRYSNTGNPRDPADSLHLYIAYHILPGIKYLADIVTAPSHPTLAPLEVLTAKLKGQAVLLNEDEFNGVVEEGIQLDRLNSDYQASNGALHAALGNIALKVRNPTPLYWDVTDQPELRKMVSVFRKSGQVLELTDPAQFSDMKWQGGTIKYNVLASSASSDYYAYDDFFTLYIRTAVTQWLEFKTPFLVKGKYKVWVCYRRARAQTIQVSVDDQVLPRLVQAGDYYPVALDDNNAEASFFKRYMVTPVSNANLVAKLVGIADISTSDRHTIRFTAISNESGSANTFNLDMVHFIPVEMEQKWPRFNKDGTAVYQ
jgi:uncharacterized surface protein with fasciclin (FAS1) repeats